MASKTKYNVQNFPRPPLLERTPRHLRVIWGNNEVLSTKEAFWVLETHHPPTYYIPPSAVSSEFKLSQIPGKTSYCEWKGQATYWVIKHPQNNEEIRAKIWSYENPTPPFKDIKGYISIYASDVPWDCFVDNEKVEAQPGDFYGGWKTSDIGGTLKGGPGTWGW